MTNRTMIELVEDAAKIRNEPPVPREFIDEILRQIHDGLIDAPRYPNGVPSLKDVYLLAVKLENETTTKN